MKSEDDQQEINRKSGLAYAAAFSLFTAVVAGLIVGWVLDRWLGTRPWLIVVGIVLGAVTGFYQFIRVSSKLT
jgi:ATP synthase protein I